MICDELKKTNVEETGHQKDIFKDTTSKMTANQVGVVGVEDQDIQGASKTCIEAAEESSCCVPSKPDSIGWVVVNVN